MSAVTTIICRISHAPNFIVLHLPDDREFSLLIVGEEAAVCTMVMVHLGNVVEEDFGKRLTFAASSGATTFSNWCNDFRSLVITRVEG
ncbi:hypothetical protein Tco_1274227 [Tanacetum coccineum]